MNLVRRQRAIVTLVATGCVTGFAGAPIYRWFHPTARPVKHTVADRLDEFAAARVRVRARCAAVHCAYPPERVVIVGLKDERRLELYVGPTDAPPRRIADFPIVGASGTLGPKLRAGDRQVPEGVYGVQSLNPNSRSHVALRLTYPNALDIARAARDGRTQPGGDIMIHGGTGSEGCLALGDAVAEELFVLAAEAGIEHVKILLAPVDLRVRTLPAGLNADDERYAELQSEFDRLRP